MSKQKIGDWQYLVENPYRVVVVRSPDEWQVWRGVGYMGWFDTHAEAIAYADSLARSRPADAQSPHPPHTRPLTANGND